MARSLSVSYISFCLFFICYIVAFFMYQDNKTRLQEAIAAVSARKIRGPK